jgi:hypothetical protein
LDATLTDEVTTPVPKVNLSSGAYDSFDEEEDIDGLV